jgi:hypothetical protein
MKLPAAHGNSVANRAPFAHVVLAAFRPLAGPTA